MPAFIHDLRRSIELAVEELNGLCDLRCCHQGTLFSMKERLGVQHARSAWRRRSSFTLSLTGELSVIALLKNSEAEWVSRVPGIDMGLPMEGQSNHSIDAPRPSRRAYDSVDLQDS